MLGKRVLTSTNLLKINKLITKVKRVQIKKLERIEFEMDGIPAVGNVATILGLEFVCSLPNNLGDLVGSFPGRTELAGSWIFGILENSA